MFGLIRKTMGHRQTLVHGVAEAAAEVRQAGTQTGRIMHVMQINKRIASDVVLHNHYLRRRPPISYAYGLSDVELFGTMYGVITFGVPASHHLRMSACKSCPDSVIELNRMWLDDVMPRNTGTWFLSRHNEPSTVNRPDSKPSNL